MLGYISFFSFALIEEEIDLLSVGEMDMEID